MVCWERKANHWWVVLPAFVGALSYAMTAAPFQQIIISIVCKQITGDGVGPQCRNPEVDSQSSLWILILTLCLTVPSLLTVGTYGAISDRYGRVKALLLPTIGLLLNRLAILAVILVDGDKPEYLIAGQLAQGFFGGMPTLFMGCFAYTADTSNNKKRSAHFGILEGFLFLGFVVGPYLGGYLSNVGKIWPFVVSGSLNLLMFLIIACTPESLPEEERPERINWSKANIFGTVGVLFSSRSAFFLAIGFLFVILCYNAFILVFVLYADIIFGWKEYEDGIFLSVQWSARSVGVGLLLPLLLRIKSIWMDGWIIKLGTLAYVGAFITYGLAQTEQVFFAATALDGIGAMVLPVFRSLLSQAVPSDEQGRMLSATGALEGTAEILAPLIFNFSLVYLVQKDPRIVFYMMCGLLVVSFFTTFFVSQRLQTKEEKPLLSDFEDEGSERSSKSQQSGTIN